MSIPFLNPTASNVADWLRKAATSVNLLIGGKQDRSDVLDDVSALSYTGNANKLIRVKATEDGLELATVSGSGLADGDYGDIVVSSGGTAINFDTSVVTAFAKTFLDDADAASVRTTIGAQASGSYQTQDATLTALASYNTNGIICQTAADTFAGRTLTGPAAGITVTNGDGVSGNPTLALANDLAALEALTGTNTIYYRSAADTWSAVTIGSGLTFTSGSLAATGTGERAKSKPVSSSFTLENAGTASITDVTDGIKLTVPSVGTQIRFVRYNSGPPATPYSVIVRAEPVSVYSGTGLYQRCLIARNSSNGRIIIYGDYNSGQHLVQRFSAYATFSANSLGPSTAYHMARQPWMRMTNDGTNLVFARSYDGNEWFDFHTEPLATYLTAAGGTCDQIGFGTLMNSLGSTSVAVFQSFEVV